MCLTRRPSRRYVSRLTQATEALQSRYLKNASAVPALFEIMATSPDLAVRQLAGVEMRKKLAKSTKVWTKHSVEVRDNIKSRDRKSVV